MSTRFLPELELALIEKHPKNPRHEAVADDELIESVKASGLFQPVVVAPLPGPEGWEGDAERGYTKPGMGVHMTRYVLIAGHRRLDALKKAKQKTAPAIVRDDLVDEGQQIEAMLIENGRRADLTPIEEAEGYKQLELLGYKPQGIAAAVGRDVKTVRSRLKLLTLSKSTQTKVHAGQLTIEDAAAFAEFADDKDATKRLEKAARDGQLKYSIEQERRRRERLQELAARVAELVDADAKPYELPPDTPIYVAQSKGLVRVFYDYDVAVLAKEHDGCLGYLEDTAGTYPQVYVLCTDPARHATEKAEDADERARWEAEQEERRREWQERREAQGAAAAVRVGTVLDLFGTNTTMPPALREVARALLPAALQQMAISGAGRNGATYMQHLNIPEDDRWEWLTTPAEQTVFGQHVADIDRWSDGILTRALVLVLLDFAEGATAFIDGLGDVSADVRTVADRYFDLLDHAGHEPSPVDKEIRAHLDGDEPEQEVS